MKELLTSFDAIEVIGYLITAIAFIFGGFFLKAKEKIKVLSNLLSAFSNAIEDNKIDANERQDLVVLAKKLLGKK